MCRADSQFVSACAKNTERRMWQPLAIFGVVPKLKVLLYLVLVYLQTHCWYRAGWFMFRPSYQAMCVSCF